MDGERRGPVVAGVDGSPAATEALRWAAATAARRRSPLRIVHGFSYAQGFAGGELPVSGDFYSALEQDGKRVLADAEEQAHEVAPRLTIETSMRTQASVPLLVHESEHASMVVLGKSGRGGFAGMLIGSTTISVVAHAHCPVTVVRTRSDGRPAQEGPVVVGVDGSGVSRDAVGVAFREAAMRETPLVALHAALDAVDAARDAGETGATVSTGPRGRQAEPEAAASLLLSESLAGWQERYPKVQVEHAVVTDRPRHQLLERSASAQLLVVGGRGRGGFAGMLLGSTSQALIHHAACPVTVVRCPPNRS